MNYRRVKRTRKKQLYRMLFFVLLCFGVGYAALMTDLSINGVANVTQSSWNIHFDNLMENQDSTATVDQAASIDTATSISYEVTLTQPGDFYEFNVDVVNEGTIDAMIESVSSKLNGTIIDNSHPLPAYLNYIITYSDGIEIANNHLLAAGDTETYRIRLEFKRDINANELPFTDQSNTIVFEVNYIQKNSASVVRPKRSFSDDSWETIVANIHNNTIPGYYTVGSTKEIELENGFGTHILRISNRSTPSECSITDFSQSACGFVLEFADTITTHIMKDNTTQGGWPGSSMYSYINNMNNSTSIINSIPVVLRNAIIDTKVISGHGSTQGETNFISVDKIYLLSTHELMEDDDGNPNDGIDYYDSAYYSTRQLDYYANNNVKAYSNVSILSKNYQTWWLRSPNLTFNQYFFITGGGNYSTQVPRILYGVSPAFRIG